VFAVNVGFLIQKKGLKLFAVKMLVF